MCGLFAVWFVSVVGVLGLSQARLGSHGPSCSPLARPVSHWVSSLAKQIIANQQGTSSQLPGIRSWVWLFDGITSRLCSGEPAGAGVYSHGAAKARSSFSLTCLLAGFGPWGIERRRTLVPLRATSCPWPPGPSMQQLASHRDLG